MRRGRRQSGRWFQHTAARRRLPSGEILVRPLLPVSTHSRPKAAAAAPSKIPTHQKVSTHSRPKAAAQSFDLPGHATLGFNTQPPEGGCVAGQVNTCQRVGFNTQPPEGGCSAFVNSKLKSSGFNTQPPEGGCGGPGRARQHTDVSTHSRPKAAALREGAIEEAAESFNTQPPEGGCVEKDLLGNDALESFNTQPPEGGCPLAWHAPGG